MTKGGRPPHATWAHRRHLSRVTVAPPRDRKTTTAATLSPPAVAPDLQQSPCPSFSSFGWLHFWS